MERTKNKEFKAWLYEEVGDAFGLTRLRTTPILQQLEKLAPAPFDKAIENLRLYLFDYVDTWNEDELKFMFISPFIHLVQFIGKNYKVFTQRPMTVTYENGTKQLRAT